MAVGNKTVCIRYHRNDICYQIARMTTAKYAIFVLNCIE